MALWAVTAVAGLIGLVLLAVSFPRKEATAPDGKKKSWLDRAASRTSLPALGITIEDGRVLKGGFGKQDLGLVKGSHAEIVRARPHSLAYDVVIGIGQADALFITFPGGGLPFKKAIMVTRKVLWEVDQYNRLAAGRPNLL